MMRWRGVCRRLDPEDSGQGGRCRCAGLNGGGAWSRGCRSGPSWIARWRDVRLAFRCGSGCICCAPVGGWPSHLEGRHSAPTGQPLVLEQGVLHPRRYREYERRLAIGLRRIAAARLPPAESAAVATVFAALFPQARAGQDRQALAAALALQRALLLVTGAWDWQDNDDCAPVIAACRPGAATGAGVVTYCAGRADVGRCGRANG